MWLLTRKRMPGAGWRRGWILSVIRHLIPVLLLSACGFKPMYAVQNNASTASLAGVQVEPVRGERRMSQLLTANLEDKLNPSGAVPARAPYRLASSVVVSSGAIGVARDGTISRYNVYLDSTYTLYSNADNSVLTTGTLRHVSSYNNLSNQYFSTYVSEQDAVKRGLTELAEVYKQRLSPFLAVK